ncbi:hypothetical protein H0H81_003779 [Sphagnurus paluster]|uniref:Uncharacterized protein n=1 Tax=Sphagnurus paluster TaxID=117069 RepID=A0A9P7GRB8_9AGAR|nr:hypothetical protein H0H81_003779 [Sphagnurus paluster]
MTHFAPSSPTPLDCYASLSVNGKMPSGSVTESDTESTVEPEDAGYFSFQKERDVNDIELLRMKTLEALERIKGFDLSVVQRDSSLHQEILEASDIILHFLDHGCTRILGKNDVAEDLLIFPSLGLF